MSKTFIDLSHTVEHGMVTYPGLPEPVISEHLSREASRAHYGPGTEFHIGKIELVANTGTYIDAPFHRHAGAKDLADLPLGSIADLEGVVISTRQDGERSIGPGVFEGRDLKGKAVLLHTGWARHWRTEAYLQGHPFLTRAAAEALVSAGAALVGIDSLNIDSTDDDLRPAHTILLQHEIPIVEHMTNLEALPADGFRFFAVPVKIRDFGSFPTRAFAIISGGE
ncbi:MAG: cyclase family protein [Anaerolineae bacterium]|nr:cyclase family protein [Anaerolineae bacterium]